MHHIKYKPNSSVEARLELGLESVETVNRGTPEP